MKKKAIVLTSGGLDSTTVLAIALSEGFDITCVSYDYGQRHKCELISAKKVSAFFGINNHIIVRLDTRPFSGSALTDDIPVPKEGPGNNIPVTYVPARNLVFLSYATALAESSGANDIFIGVNSIDYSGYPDCRPEFISAFGKAVESGTKCGVNGEKININTPIINMTKEEIIAKGIELGVDYSITHSCYDPDDNGLACGHCDSCRIRLTAFAKLGIKDPIKYMDR